MDPISILSLVVLFVEIGKNIFDLATGSMEKRAQAVELQSQRRHRHRVQQQLRELELRQRYIAHEVSEIRGAQITQFRELCAFLEDLRLQLTLVQQMLVCSMVFFAELAVYFILSQHFSPEVSLYKDLIRLLFFAVSSCYISFGSRWSRLCSYVLCFISIYFSVTRAFLVTLANYSSAMFISCLIMSNTTPYLVKRVELSSGSVAVEVCSKVSWAACFTLSVLRIVLLCWPGNATTAHPPVVPLRPYTWEIIRSACHIGFSFWCSYLEPMQIAYWTPHKYDSMQLIFVLLQVIGFCLPCIAWCHALAPAESFPSKFASKFGQDLNIGADAEVPVAVSYMPVV
jgi:hypothetical protein